MSYSLADMVKLVRARTENFSEKKIAEEAIERELNLQMRAVFSIFSPAKLEEEAGALAQVIPAINTETGLYADDEPDGCFDIKSIKYNDGANVSTVKAVRLEMLEEMKENTLQVDYAYARFGGVIYFSFNDSPTGAGKYTNVFYIKEPTAMSDSVAFPFSDAYAPAVVILAARAIIAGCALSEKQYQLAVQSLSTEWQQLAPMVREELHSFTEDFAPGSTSGASARPGPSGSKGTEIES